MFLRKILHRVGVVDNRDDGVNCNGRTIGLDAALFGKLDFARLDIARTHGDVGETVNQCLDAVAGAAARKSDVHIRIGLSKGFGGLLNHGQNRRGTVDDQITGKRGGRSGNHRSGKAEFLEHLRFFLHCNSMSEGLL